MERVFFMNDEKIISAIKALSIADLSSALTLSPNSFKVFSV